MGRRLGYTEFVKQTPADTVVLTLACGKYRFNDLDLGTIGGLPRLMDVGQCNDAYGAVKIALALAEAFGCGVNDLPLSLVLSWYEQKAVCILLTLACGKYRFNDLDLGTIGGLPRLMDVGQCNDAYGAVKIALALAEAFGCGVNDLPLSMVLSWYEQKAVCILLTLLHLGIKNIRLGPTLPAFVSPNVLNYLVENFGIAPITTPEEDLKQLLK